jgi:hypothetical protein
MNWILLGCHLRLGWTDEGTEKAEGPPAVGFKWTTSGREKKSPVTFVPHVREPTPGRRCLSRPLACALPSLVAPTGTPPPPYARCLDLHLGDLLRRRAPTRYAHPFLFLLCETEHPNPSFSVPAVRNRAPKPKLSVFGSDLI